MMDIKDIQELLAEFAEKDLAEGADIFDHPCSVASRALDQCVEDIQLLKRIANEDKRRGFRGSKKVQILLRSKSYSVLEPVVSMLE